MKTTEIIQTFQALCGLTFGAWTKRSAFMPMIVVIPAPADVLVA